MTKILRQAIETTPEQLRKIADQLDVDLKDVKKIGMVPMRNQKCLVVIINKKPECSDTWRFEE